VIGIGVGQHPFFENSGTVHQYIDLTCGTHETILRCAVEKIGTNGPDRAARGRSKIGCGLVRDRLMPPVKDDIGTFTEESHGSRMADTAGGASDQNPAA
jgi:hypothetical protein